MEPFSFRSEAAHFALLGRLAPSLRHRMMGILHPIALLTELAGRQISGDHSQIERTRDTLAKLRQHSRDATSSTTGLLAWITGEETRTIRVHEGIETLIALLRTDSEVRGVRINHVADMGADDYVSRRALRTIVAAALIATVDMRPPFGTVRVSACTDNHTATVRIDAQYSEQASSVEHVSEDRLLSWEDVVVLAEAERIELRRVDDPYCVLCRFPILTA